MKTKILIVLIVLVFFVPLFSFAQNEAQWPTFQGNNARTGFSDSTLPSKLTVLWQWTVGDFKKIGFYQPSGINNPKANKVIINNDKVFFGIPEIFSLDFRTGKKIWRYRDNTIDFYPNGLAAGGGKIFVAVNDSSLMKAMSRGLIYALDENSGEFLWKYQTQKPITHPQPLYAEEKVFIGDESGTIYAINAQSGELVWKKFLDAEQIHSSPAFYNGTIFIGTEGTGASNVLPSYLFALDAQTGSVLWKFQVDYFPDKVCLVHATPSILNDVVYFGGESGYFYALSANDGKLIWKKQIASGPDRFVGVSAPAALGYGKIFVKTWEGNFLAIDQSNGDILWKYYIGTGEGDAPAFVVDKKACTGCHEGFCCFNEEDGELILEKKPAGPPVFASGILVVPNTLITESSDDQTSVITAYFEGEEPTQEPIRESVQRPSQAPVKEIEEPEEAVTPEFKEEIKKEVPKEITEELEKESKEIQKNVFQKIWDIIINFFKKIF